MAMNHPGVGDPLGGDNPYADGRPNWNLQSKARGQRPADNLSLLTSASAVNGTGGISNWEIKGPAGYPPMKSPYSTDYPEAYTKTLPRALEDKGMRHFEGNPHLARTTAERQEGGIGHVNHLLSGYDKAQRPTGRLPVQAVKHADPKDGGIWEPVKRVYPSVPRVDYGNGVRICDRPKVENRLVDIWPATISVRDDFKPGGTKQFEGKRNTDKNAFPSAIGYSPPKNYDENGRRIDYSSVEQGGPFGVKMLHSNSPVPLPDNYQDRYLADKTSKSKTLGELGELNKASAQELSGPQTGKHGSVFPFRPASAGRRGRGARPHSSQAQTGASTVEPALSFQATRSTAAIPAIPPAAPHASHLNSHHGPHPILHHPLHPQPSLPVPPRPRRDPSQQEPIHMPPPPSYGRRAGSTSSRGASPGPAAASAAAPSSTLKVQPFSPRGKQYYEFPLQNSTKWTQFGGFRP